MATEGLDIVVRERGSKIATRNIRDIGKAGKAAGDQVGLLRRALGLLGGALVLRSAVRTIADFSQAMSTVRAITRATGDQFKDLEDKARDLGATTRFTATQAAEGMLFLARTGFDTNQVLGTIEGTLKLAQAGALDLGRAADIASNVLKSFRLEVDQTGRVVDILASAANSSNTNVEQLGDALKFVAPVASGMGVAIEEATAAVGELSNNGLQATLAGTGLRRILSELESPATKTTRIFRALGVEANEVRISQVGLTNAIQRLKDAGVDAGLALEIFGDRGGPAFEILSKGTGTVRELTKTLKNSAGEADRVARIMDDNLNGALLRVKSAFESVQISLGKAGAESSLTGILERLASLLRLVAANADILAEALTILGTVILGKLVAVAIPALVRGLKALSIQLLAISARALPLIATAGVAAFATLAAIAKADGKTISQVFEEIKGQVIGLVEGFLEPTEAVNAFEARIGVLAAEIRKAGGVAKLTSEQAKGLVSRIKDLREEINNKLLFQQFLAPGSEGVKQLTDQVAVLDGALAALKKRIQEGPGGKPILKPTGGDTGPKPTQFSSGQLEELTRLKAELDPLGDLVTQLEQKQDLLNAAFQAGKIGLDEYNTLLANLNDQYKEAGGDLLVEYNIENQRQLDLLKEIKGPQLELAERLRTLNDLYRLGAISQEEFNQQQREANIRALRSQRDAVSGAKLAFLELTDDASNFAAQTKDLVKDAFSEATDALLEFTKTGKFEFGDLARSVADNLLKIASNEFFLLLSGQGGGLKGGGLGGLATSFFGGGGGVGSFLSSLLPFAHGGQFTVGGGNSVATIPGLDNRLVAFRARDGEEVSVAPPGGAHPGRPLSINFHFPPGTDVESFRRSQGQIAARTAAGLARANARNN